MSEQYIFQKHNIFRIYDLFVYSNHFTYVWPQKNSIRKGCLRLIKSVLQHFTPIILGQPKDSLSDVDCAVSETETLRVRNVVDATRFLGAWLRAGEGIGWLAAGTMPNSLYRMPLVYLSLTCVFCYSCSYLFVVCVFVFFFALIGAW